MATTSVIHSRPKPWSSLFYYPSSAFRPFPSPLQAISQSRPSAVILFSLSELDEGLVVNVLVGTEADKARLRNRLWGGAIIRFSHLYNTFPFTQLPADVDNENKITIASVSPDKDVAVRVVTLKVFTADDGPIRFKIVPETEEPLATSFRQFVEKRVWELEMGSVDVGPNEDDE